MTMQVHEIREAGELISVDDAIKILETTEPLQDYEFKLDGTSQVKFSLPDGWNDGIEEEEDTCLTDCSVQIDGVTIFLTKQAILTMTSAVGLQKPYVSKTPGPLVEPHLNYWVNNSGVAATDAMKVMVSAGNGVGFIKSSKSVFENVPVFEKVIDRIISKFGTDDLWVDYKIEHNLERSALRVIVPAYVRTIKTKRFDGQEDDWSIGVQITNSLMAHPETKLNVSGYLYSQTSTNGAISQHATSGNYNRRVQGQDYHEVIEWIGESTDHILNDLTLELEDVEGLVDISLVGELSDVVQDIFNELKVPKPVRKSILDTLVDSDDLTGYGLMQAVTAAANDPFITDKVRENTMRIGGAIPHILTDRCSECHRVHVG